MGEEIFDRVLSHNEKNCVDLINIVRVAHDVSNFQFIS